MTNYERIMSMSETELAVFLYNVVSFATKNTAQQLALQANGRIDITEIPADGIKSQLEYLRSEARI